MKIKNKKRSSYILPNPTPSDELDARGYPRHEKQEEVESDNDCGALGPALFRIGGQEELRRILQWAAGN